MECCDEATWNVLKELEEELLDSNVRKNSGKLMELLAEDFREFGSSGRAFTREQIVASLAEEKVAVILLENFAAKGLAEGCVLVTYRASRVEDGLKISESLRSSIWTWQEGRWQIVFHQGTKS